VSVEVSETPAAFVDARGATDTAYFPAYRDGEFD